MWAVLDNLQLVRITCRLSRTVSGDVSEGERGRWMLCRERMSGYILEGERGRWMFYRERKRWDQSSFY